MRDMMGMMKQAQAMQAKMQALQEEMEQLTVEGSAGGGMVKLVMTGKGAIKSVSIDPSLMTADEREILEDLIVAAAADAKAKSERVMGERMGELTKGLPIPPGMKLF
jgi:DNA-binding YbaB/EbfC family protein